MLRALRRHRRPPRVVATAAGLVAAYLAVGRPLMLHWGANCLMERKMLLRIKERAERAYTAETRRAAQSAPIRTPVHV